MTLIKSESKTLIQTTAEITIDGRTTRLSTDWVDRFMHDRSYGELDQLRKRVKDVVARFEESWGPVQAHVVFREHRQVTTVQTYCSSSSKITSTMKAGRA